MDPTPTERRILALLADGRAHTRAELLALLSDDLGAPSNVRAHVSNLRRRLRPKGEEIVCEVRYRCQVCYRHVRLLTPAAGT